MPPTALDLRAGMLLLVLYVPVLLSPIAFIEPSPHDRMMPEGGRVHVGAA